MASGVGSAASSAADLTASHTHGVVTSTVLSDGQQDGPFISRHELEEIAMRLNTNVDIDQLKTRPVPGGKQAAYMSGDTAIAQANEVFGFNRWSTQLIKSDCLHVTKDNSGTWSATFCVHIRVNFLDRGAPMCWHEDIGYGSSDRQPKVDMALEMAHKGAVTDAFKRAIRYFGPALGASINSAEMQQAAKDYSKNKGARTMMPQGGAGAGAGAAAARPALMPAAPVTLVPPKPAAAPGPVMLMPINSVTVTSASTSVSLDSMASTGPMVHSSSTASSGAATAAPGATAATAATAHHEAHTARVTATNVTVQLQPPVVSAAAPAAAASSASSSAAPLAPEAARARAELNRQRALETRQRLLEAEAKAQQERKRPAEVVLQSDSIKRVRVDEPGHAGALSASSTGSGSGSAGSAGSAHPALGVQPVALQPVTVQPVAQQPSPVRVPHNPAASGIYDFPASNASQPSNAGSVKFQPAAAAGGVQLGSSAAAAAAALQQVSSAATPAVPMRSGPLNLSGSAPIGTPGATIHR